MAWQHHRGPAVLVGTGSSDPAIGLEGRPEAQLVPKIIRERVSRKTRGARCRHERILAEITAACFRDSCRTYDSPACASTCASASSA